MGALRNGTWKHEVVVLCSWNETSSILTCDVQTFKKQDPEFCFNNFMLVSPFPLPVQKSLPMCSWAWLQHTFGSLLVPGTPRRCVSHQMSLYPTFPGLRLSPYLVRLDKNYFMVLLRSCSNLQRPEGHCRCWKILWTTIKQVKEMKVIVVKCLGKKMCKSDKFVFYPDTFNNFPW